MTEEIRDEEIKDGEIVDKEDKETAGSTDGTPVPEQEQDAAADPEQQWTPSCTKKKGRLVRLCIALVIIAGAAGGFWYTEQQNALPENRMEQTVAMLKAGNLDGAEAYASTDDYFRLADMTGPEATDAQKQQMAEILFRDLEMELGKPRIDKAGKKAVFHATVKNYAVYPAAMNMELDSGELEGKTEQQAMDILLKKSQKSANKLRKKGEKVSSRVVITMVRRDGKWVIDGSDPDNQLALLACMGIQTDAFTVE